MSNPSFFSPLGIGKSVFFGKYCWVLAGLLLTVCLVGSAATAQSLVATLELGAVLPLSGSDQERGRVEAAALRASAERLRSRGLELTLTLADSRSDPSELRVQAEALIEGGVHVLVCCDTPEQAAQLGPLAAAEGVPLMTLSATSQDAPGTATWLFALGVADVAQLERLQLEPDLQPYGLMAPVGAAGDAAVRTLRVQAGVARYPAARPQLSLALTPEALWVATREPGSVVVWDGASGTVRAAEALSARGYGGPLVVQATLWDTLNALERAKLSGALSVLSPAALGYTLADAHPSKQAVSSFRRALIGLPDSDLTETNLSAGASAWDAAQLVGSAAEQLLVYGLETTDTRGLRQALRDTLVGLGPVTGAGGSYDFSEGQANGLDPASLVVATWRSGRFRLE